MKTAPLAKEDRHQLLLSDSRIRTASSNPMEVKLCSGIRPLDEFLRGGLAFSTLTEWGIPFGNGGRRLMASFLASATSGAWDGGQKLWCLWASARPQFDLYPPAWKAAGVELPRLRFARSPAPVKDLKPLFIDSFFRVLVLDNPPELTLDDCCFLSNQARKNQQLIFVLRDQPLSASIANVWAKHRFNIRRHHDQGTYEIETIRGVCNGKNLAFRFDPTLNRYHPPEREAKNLSFLPIRDPSPFGLMMTM